MPPSKPIAEFTWGAVLLGVFVGILFGSANAYLGLKVGMTVSASIPAAILGIAFYRLVQKKPTVLETNMVQTVGSAAGSVAAGMIFTIPAFFLWGMDPGTLKIFVISLFGGVLGVMFMIPLRQFLIVKEHENLPYPEGTACAEVIQASDEGGSKASILFKGLGGGLFYEFLMAPQALGLWSVDPHYEFSFLKKARVGMETTPELLGIGYIIGPRIAALIFAGGAIGAMVLVPLIALVGASNPEIAAMSAGAIRSHYVKMIGVGAVGGAGILTLVKSFPTIWHSFVAGLKGMKAGSGEKVRTETDIPFKIVILISAATILGMWWLPDSFMPVGFLGAFCVFIFGFFFVTVSSRIVGLVGVSSNPVSGMTIATLLITASLFVAFGMAGDLNLAKAAILTVGGVVCTAASIAGDVSQDLKTGFLLKATPLKQQVGEFVGVVTSAAVLCFVIYLFKTPVQTGELAAPQANLMAIIIDGVLNQNVPWNLVLLGVALAVIIDILGLPSLAFAVGLYLPFSLATPIFAGGLVRAYFDRKKGPKAGKIESGILLSSGLIAGAAVLGVILTALVGLADVSPAVHGFLAHLWDITEAVPKRGYIHVTSPGFAGLGDLGSVIFFSLLTVYLWNTCRRTKG